MVGKGAFGKVRIVERKDTGLTFALKYIRKDEGESLHHTESNEISGTDVAASGSVGECSKYHPGTEDAGTAKPSLPM